MRPNPHLDPAAVPAESRTALAFHHALPEYAPTPLRDLGGGAAVKDENGRLGLPAFKALGASWALECALREHPGIGAVVCASAGNHGRAVARMAARRGLPCRVYLPARSLAVRRAAIEAEGAELVVVDGTYEDAVARAQADGRGDGVLELADVGDSPSAHAVIDGYATLFAELDDAGVDVLLVPVGVGSLAAAAARWGAPRGVEVVGVEPVAAACLAAALEAGEPVAVDTPGTVMAGMDCAVVSPAAWPSLRAGISGTIMIADDALGPAFERLAAAGMDAGECSAATVAALDRLDPGGARRVVCIGSEGPTARKT